MHFIYWYYYSNFRPRWSDSCHAYHYIWGSNLAEGDQFLRVMNILITVFFGRKLKLESPCQRLMAHKRTLSLRGFYTYFTYYLLPITKFGSNTTGLQVAYMHVDMFHLSSTIHTIPLLYFIITEKEAIFSVNASVATYSQIKLKDHTCS